jgi:hypothetical protein
MVRPQEDIHLQDGSGLWAYFDELAMLVHVLHHVVQLALSHHDRLWGQREGSQKGEDAKDGVVIKLHEKWALCYQLAMKCNHELELPVCQTREQRKSVLKARCFHDQR